MFAAAGFSCIIKYKEYYNRLRIKTKKERKNLMNLKYVGIIALAVSFTWGCGNKKGNTDNESASSQQQEQAPQTQQDLNQFQPQQQGGEISDEELQKFVSASQQLQVINQEAQQSMIKIVEDEGLDPQRFNEIMQAQQNPNQEANATGEELKQAEAATKGLQKIQTQAMQQMQEKISDSGLTEQKFQEISMMLQNDPELQQRFQSLQQQ